MALLTLTVNLLVADVNATAHFYTDVLGFKITLGVVEGTEDVVFGPTDATLGFAILERDEVQIMLQSHASVAADLPAFQPGQGDVVALYIDVDDVDSLWEQLKDRVELVTELRTTFYGSREFHFRDPDGHIVGFAQRLSEEH